MDALPCSNCHADCCGPIPLYPRQLARIEEYLTTLPAEDIDALSSQRRRKLTCAFVDTRTHICSIYPVRPALCDLYGRTEGLECPHHRQLVQIISPQQASLRLELEKESGVPILSNEWKWSKLRAREDAGVHPMREE